MNSTSIVGAHISCQEIINDECIHSLIDACCNYVKSLIMSSTRSMSTSLVRTVMRFIGKIIKPTIERFGFKVRLYESTLYLVDPGEKFWSFTFPDIRIIK